MSDALFSYDVIRSELRSHAEKKKKKKKEKSNKTCCNQNMPALSLFRWSVELIDIQSFFNCSVQRIRAFLSLNQRILLSLVSKKYNIFLHTYSAMHSSHKWAHFELE